MRSAGWIVLRTGIGLTACVVGIEFWQSGHYVFALVNFSVILMPIWLIVERLWERRRGN